MARTNKTRPATAKVDKLQAPSPDQMAMNASPPLPDPGRDLADFRRKVKAKDEKTEELTKDEAVAAAVPAAAPASVVADDDGGTRKLKSDLDAMMDDMQREMDAGKSKLARLRERIRRAKGAITETDQALANAPKAWSQRSQM